MIIFYICRLVDLDDDAVDRAESYCSLDEVLDYGHRLLSKVFDNRLNIYNGHVFFRLGCCPEREAMFKLKCRSHYRHILESRRRHGPLYKVGTEFSRYN